MSRIIGSGSGGGGGLSPRQVSANATAADGDLLLVDASGGAVTITVSGDIQFGVVKTDASTNAVTISATVGGVVSPVLRVRHQKLLIQGHSGSYYVTGT